ncbi:SIR2 family protein [Sorangium cellulosum]|uniref:SIR2 family protein n=1 Tax=Sorangium cellulosum TaxID=56 RepID=UPI0003FD6618|nr:SIR2 family protein [Sorangium cellulosum]
MSNTPETWTLKGFLNHFEFVHSKMEDHAFAWVLGAGASKASGIPTGGELVERWLKELHERLDTTDSPIETWATAENLKISNFTYSNAATFYPRVYERRFCNNPEEGFACLEDMMARIEPSPGYSILAKAMESTRHRVVITTNFDNLVADALAIYTTAYPLVAGHELLTSFVRVAMRRPLVCKIHRDLLLAPKNDSRSLKRLHESWAATLRNLFSQFTPIFIGYGGNDDSLMDLLESLEPGEIKGQAVWCYYEKSEPSERICNLVAQHRGILVPTPDFDTLMLLVGSKMKIEPLGHVLGKRAEERVGTYQKRILDLDVIRHPELIPALESAVGRANVGWWAWELKAKAEKDPSRKEQVYRLGIQRYPDSLELHRNLAYSLWRDQENVADAERIARSAHSLKPNSAQSNVLLAAILSADSASWDEAEHLFRRAVELDPKALSALMALAYFLSWKKKELEEAEKLHRLAIQNAPQESVAYGGFANFLWQHKNDVLGAEEHYMYALELDPDNANARVNFSGLLLSQDRPLEALPSAKRSFKQSQLDLSTITAESLFYIGMGEQFLGRDDSAALAQLKTLFHLGFRRGEWSFDSVLAAAKRRLSSEQLDMYTAISAAILDKRNVDDLERLDRWKALTPVPLGGTAR